MARIFKTPFGAQGDTEQVPEAPQGDGSVSLTQGFGYDYEREYEDPAAKDIRREVMNGLFHDITEAIGDIQLSGVAKWNAAAAPYPAGAIVWHNSVAWQSRVNNNSTTPSEGAGWTAVATAASVGNAYVPLTRTITAGTGLSGGGNLSANRTISIANSHIPIGVGQTWQDFTGSRSANTTYTNTTGRPIAVSIVAAGTGPSGNSMSILVEDEGVYSSPAYSTTTTCSLNNIVIPAGAAYRLNRGGLTTIDDIQFWKELR